MNNEDKQIMYKIGDAREEFTKIKDKSVGLVVTSPPYNIDKDYGKYDDNQEFEEWKKMIDEITSEAHRVLEDSGSFCLNVSPVPMSKDKEIVPLPAIAWEIGKENGFKLRNWITWRFHSMVNCTNRLSGRWEAVLWFVKDLDEYKFNLDDIRVPYRTDDNRIDGDGRNPTDVWKFDRVNNMTKKKLDIDHPTVYPLEMIERIIKMTTDEGDVVLDPFLGSGTTLIAAKKQNRRGIGFEIDEDYADTIEHRLKNETEQQKLNSFTSDRSIKGLSEIFK